MLDADITEPVETNVSVPAVESDSTTDSSITGVGGVVHCRYVVLFFRFVEKKRIILEH